MNLVIWLKTHIKCSCLLYLVELTTDFVGVVTRDGGYILSTKLDNVKNNSMNERKIKQWEPVFWCWCVYCDFIDLGYQTVSFSFFSHPVICIAQVGTIRRFGANKTIWFLW